MLYCRYFEVSKQFNHFIKVYMLFNNLNLAVGNLTNMMCCSKGALFPWWIFQNLERGIFIKKKLFLHCTKFLHFVSINCTQLMKCWFQSLFVVDIFFIMRKIQYNFDSMCRRGTFKINICFVIVSLLYFIKICRSINEK